MGVVVGVILNGAIGRWQERRAESDELRAAARLLCAELLELYDHVQALEMTCEPDPPSTMRWEEFGPLIARMLDLHTWRTIQAGATVLHTLEKSALSDQLYKTCLNRVGDAIEALSGPMLWGTRGGPATLRQELRRLVRRLPSVRGLPRLRRPGRTARSY